MEAKTKRTYSWFHSYNGKIQIHRVLLCMWILLLPVSFIMMNSVAWVVFMSHYAILAGEASALLAARASKEASPEE